MIDKQKLDILLTLTLFLSKPWWHPLLAKSFWSAAVVSLACEPTLWKYVKEAVEQNSDTYSLLRMRQTLQSILTCSMWIWYTLGMLKVDLDGLKLLLMAHGRKHDHLIAATVAVMHRVYRSKVVLMKCSECSWWGDKDMWAIIWPFLLFQLSKFVRIKCACTRVSVVRPNWA